MILSNPAEPYGGSIDSCSRGIYDANANPEPAQSIAPPPYSHRFAITACVCENPGPAEPHIYERDMARRWYALNPHTRLPLSDGEYCTLLFAGLPGGSAGPDVQDAILAFPDQRTGAVEFHRRASDWYAHQHHRDARYNGVILHVVLTCDMLYPVLRQNGTAIPTCSLFDLTSSTHSIATPKTDAEWPCQQIIPGSSSAIDCAHLLRRAGILRFEQKAHTFVEHIHNGQSAASYSLYDACLLLALAEGLGYGRDRAFFRAAGARLLGLADAAPVPLGLADQPPRLDANRLSALRELIEAWRETGAWNIVCDAIMETDRLSQGFPPQIVEIEPDGRSQGFPPGIMGERAGDHKGPHPTTTSTPAPTISERDEHRDAVEQLRALFTPAGISAARADIIICNVVLPFAHAVGLVENDAALAKAACALYLDYPSLSSNRVTRAMTRQLLLPREPSGACQQQGLHYIYQQTCQEKRCEQCIVGRRVL